MSCFCMCFGKVVFSFEYLSCVPFFPWFLLVSLFYVGVGAKRMGVYVAMVSFAWCFMD